MNKIFICSLLVIFTLACDTPEEKPAEVKVAQEIKKFNKDEEEEINEYFIHTEKSELNWIGRKPAGKHHGSFGLREGKLYVKNDTLYSGKIVIDMNEIDVVDLRSDEDSYMKLVEHLRSEDFFDVENHPLSVFEITDVNWIKPASAEESQYDYEAENKSPEDMSQKVPPPNYKITGNLTLRGNTLSVTFPAYLDISDAQVRGVAKFSIDRTLWGVKHREEAEFKDKAQDKLIYNDVAIELSIVANRENSNI